MKSSIAYRGALLWNHLPEECRKAVSLGSFTKNIHEQNAVKDNLILVNCTVRRFR